MMRLKTYLFAAALVIISSCTAGNAVPEQGAKPCRIPEFGENDIEGELLVRFDESVADLLEKTGMTRSGPSSALSVCALPDVDEVLGMLDGYSIFVWMVMITAFVTDTCAYFSGVFFGKHKMTPVISPKKTWEGAVGGVIGTIIVSGIFGFVFMRPLLVDCMVIGLLGAVISMFGDLTASIFKRKMGIKDYGSLIPGHGGILDRFDSVLFTAPVIYYYIVLVIGA